MRQELLNAVMQIRVGDVRRRCIVSLCLLAMFNTSAPAAVLSEDFEIKLLRDVSTAWQTVSLLNTYSNAIPVCTYVLADFSSANPPAVIRIRNILPSSFELKIQGWENSSATTSDVHCIVADEGEHSLPDGRKFEAHTVVSDKTSGQFSTDGAWSIAILENVSTAVIQSYTAPIMLGQVISYNDSRASVFYNNDCDSRLNPAFLSGQSDGACIGKHIGMIAGTRNPETIGYIVAESGRGTVNNIHYELALGADSVAGSGSTPDFYPLSQDHHIAVLSQGAEDGGNGSWAVLYGADPLPANQLFLQVDEEVFAGDTTRKHTNEQVFYWSFAAAELTLLKQVVNESAAATAVAADFSLWFDDGSGNAGVGFSGSAAVSKVVVAPGSYSLGESPVPRYSLTGITCDGSDSNGMDGLTIALGESVTCTLVNDDLNVDLALNKTVSDITPNIGQVVTFTLAVKNTGPDIATNLQIADILPAGFAYVSGSIAGGDSNDESSPSGTGLGWVVGSLASGAAVSLTFQATVLAP